MLGEYGALGVNFSLPGEPRANVPSTSDVIHRILVI